MKIDRKRLLLNVLVPIILGTVVGLLTSRGYSSINKPSFAPPGILFPIVWTILYGLMGVSNYLIGDGESLESKEAGDIYYLQLGINLLWSFWFFSLKLYLFSFLWILLLIGVVIIMIIKFYKVNKLSAYLQIPYLLWLIFASILSLSIYLIN